MKRWTYYVFPVALYVWFVRRFDFEPVVTYYMVDNDILIRPETLNDYSQTS